jgi:WD40 repeat protein
MIKHTAPTSGIATYQNQYIATAGYDNRVILWDALKHQALAVGHHDHLVNQCAFSADGRWLATSSSDYSARLWSVPEMQLCAVFSDHQDDVEGLAFHPSEPWLATTSRDHGVRVFDFSGRCLFHFSGHQRDVLSVHWLNDNQLVSCGDDGTIRYWDLSSAAQFHLVSCDGVETDTIAVTDNGWIFSGNDAGEILRIDGSNKSALLAHQAGIKRLCYSAGQQQLVSLSYDGTLAIWQVCADGQLQLIKRAHYPRQVWARSCAFLNAEEMVFVSFSDRYVRYLIREDRWDLNGSQATGGINAITEYGGDRYTVGDAGEVRCNGVKQYKVLSLCNVIAHIHGRLLVAGQTGELFNAVTGEVLYRHHSPINTLASYALTDGVTAVYIGTYTGELVVFHSSLKQFVFVCHQRIHENAIKSVAVNARGVFSVSASGDAARHDLAGCECIRWYQACHDKIANDCVAIGTEGFASVSRDRYLRIFSSEQIERVETPHQYSIKSLAVSANGEYVATGDYHGLLCLYHLPSKTWQQSRPTISGISCLTYDEQQSCFLLGSYDGGVYVRYPERVVSEATV